jgi:lysophospholipase L1-like esterase
MKCRKYILFFVLALLGVGTYYIVTIFQEAFGVAEELPAYSIPPKHNDDTLRVAIIGDSWAWIHAEMNYDTLFEQYAQRLTSRPVKCFSKGHNGQKTKGVYYDMFANRDVKYEWERTYCTQSLLEQHPDYCIVMAGINDLCRQVPPETYAENYRLIIQLLLKNGIRPVVMEIPEFDVVAACKQLGEVKYNCYRYLSLFTRAGWNVSKYRKKLQAMLHETSLMEQVVYISVETWNPGGVFKQPGLYQEDRFHLNQQGYKAMDSIISKRII